MQAEFQVTRSRLDWRRKYPCVICETVLRVGSFMMFGESGQHGIHRKCRDLAVRTYREAVREAKENNR